MNRKARVDAVFESTKGIKDPDAFQLVINAEQDNYVLADLRDLFWNGQGPKPWQVVEINRLLTSRREQRDAPLDTRAKEDATVQVARISARQLIITSVITAIAGLVGAYIQYQVSGATPKIQLAPQQHWLRITSVVFENTQTPTQFRIIAYADGIPFSHPGHAIFAVTPGTPTPSIFPLPVGLSRHDLAFEVYYKQGNDVLKHAKGSPRTISSIPYEGDYVMRDVVEGVRGAESVIRVYFEIRVER